MEARPEDGDIPFPHAMALQDALKISGLSMDEHLVSCHLSETCYKFPRAYLLFIKLLLQVNDEITQTWTRESEPDQPYWISLRAYLNDLLLQTLTDMQAKERPVALACWLHREFLLCRHDDSGRMEYQTLMESTTIIPYGVDIFELDWLTWWSLQTEHEYYESSHFTKVGKLLKNEWEVIKIASESLLWNDVDGHEEDPQDPNHASSNHARSPNGDPPPGDTAVFVFKCLVHPPPKPPCEDNGDLDWDTILERLESLSQISPNEDPDIATFLSTFDLVRFLDKEVSKGFDELKDFLWGLCKQIHAAVQSCHAQLMAYLKKELSLDEREARKDVEMISSWLQQFKT